MSTIELSTIKSAKNVKNNGTYPIKALRNQKYFKKSSWKDNSFHVKMSLASENL